MRGKVNLQHSALMLFGVLVAMGAGWLAKERYQSARELAIVEQLGASNVVVAGKYDDLVLRAGESQTWWRRLGRSLVGPRVVVAGLNHLEELAVSATAVTDFAPLYGLANLRSLQIGISSDGDSE